MAWAAVAQHKMLQTKKARISMVFVFTVSSLFVLLINMLVFISSAAGRLNRPRCCSCCIRHRPVAGHIGWVRRR